MNNYIIAPVQLRYDKQKRLDNICFIIMPFANEKNKAYEAIKQAIRDCGMIAERSDDSKQSIAFMTKIINSIATASYLIVDISALNANVFYELGIAHTLRSYDRVLILKDSKTICPGDIKHINYFEYDTENLLELYNHVKNFLNEEHIINDLKGIMYISDIIEINQDADYALNKIHEKLRHYSLDLVHIFNNIFDDIDNICINKIMISIYELLLENIDDRTLNTIYLKLLCHIIKKLPTYFNIEKFINHVFGLASFDENKMNELNMKTEIAVNIFKFDYYYEELYDWIKLFLCNSSPASINISRYKINIGLINSNSIQTSRFLLKNLKEQKNDYLLEHTINICKAKLLKESIEYVLDIIESTINPYVFRSSIDLIADIGSFEQYNKMFEIILNKEDLINNNKFIHKHIERAKQKVK